MRTVDPVKHAQKRAAIRDAAARVFAEQGYAGATTTAICRAAGVGSGTLFHYFGDKRSIMVAIFAEDHAANDAVVATLDESRPVAEIGRLLDHLVRDVGDPAAPGIVLAMLQLAVGDLEFAAMLEDGDGRVRAALARLVRRAVADGAVVGIDPDRAGRWLLGLVDTLFLMAGDDGFDPALDVAELRLLAARYLGVPDLG